LIEQLAGGKKQGGEVKLDINNSLYLNFDIELDRNTDGYALAW
jgi:hypothetical protein